jgi:hypothetical protein
MKLVYVFLFVGSLMAHGHDYPEVFDVTKGIVRRNWGLTKENSGIKFQTMWFTNKEACEAFKSLFYKEQAAECILYSK